MNNTPTSLYQSRIPAPNGRWETSSDLAHEQALKSLIESKWNCQLIKQPQYDSEDYHAVRNDRTISWVEMRFRNCEHTTYNDLFMGKEKFMKLRNACRALEIACIFVVMFADQTRWYVDLTLIERPTEQYASRGDVQTKRVTDNERAVLLPMKGFTRL